MNNDDWNEGPFWDGFPDPPGEENDAGGTWLDKSGEDAPGPYDIPQPGDFPLDAYEWTLGISEEVIDIRDWITNPDNVNPENLRGIGFVDPGEALDWLEAIGLIAFSEIIEIDDLYFPVIGDSDEAGAG